MVAANDGIVVPDTIRIITIIATVCLSIAGLVGNLAVCVIILSYKSMYTTTNLYLLSLSISEIMILIAYGIRQTIMLRFVGFVIIELILKTAVNASILIVTAFTCERYLATCHPFILQKSRKKCRTNRIITIVWFIAALPVFLSPVYLIFGPTKEELIPEMRKILLALEIFSFVLFYIIPTIMMTVMYILIWLKLRERSNGLQLTTRTDHAIKRTLTMFVVIIAAFIFCWAPYYIVKMTRAYLKLYADIEAWHRIRSVSHLILMVSVTVYPALKLFILAVMSENFREAFEDLLFNLWRKFFKSKLKSTDAQTTDIALQDMSRARAIPVPTIIEIN